MIREYFRLVASVKPLVVCRLTAADGAETPNNKPSVHHLVMRHVRAFLAWPYQNHRATQVRHCQYSTCTDLIMVTREKTPSTPTSTTTASRLRNAVHDPFPMALWWKGCRNSSRAPSGYAAHDQASVQVSQVFAMECWGRIHTVHAGVNPRTTYARWKSDGARKHVPSCRSEPRVRRTRILMSYDGSYSK